MNCAYDFNNIKKEDVYFGDIILIKKVNYDILKQCKSIRTVLGVDYSSACKTVIAKPQAVLIKVSDKYFVDLDAIRRGKDIEHINFCLFSNITDNVLLKNGTYNPYVGSMYVTNLVSAKDKEFVRTDIKSLKKEYKEYYGIK